MVHILIVHIYSSDLNVVCLKSRSDLWRILNGMFFCWAVPKNVMGLSADRLYPYILGYPLCNRNAATYIFVAALYYLQYSVQKKLKYVDSLNNCRTNVFIIQNYITEQMKIFIAQN